jgi:hypothetical protein
MRLTSATESGTYRRLGPIIFDHDIIGVTEGKYVLGSVRRKSVTAIRQEKRKSFKHPIAGMVVGLAMALAPLLSVIGSPFGVGLALTSLSRIAGAFFMFLLGVYLLWGVVTRKDESWIVFIFKSGERAFPIPDELSTNETEKLLKLLHEGPGAVEPPIERALGFEVLPAKPPTPKEDAC